MQAPALLLCWGSYRWAHNLWVLIIYLFFLPVILPSVAPRLALDLAVRMFPGVWKLLSFLRLPSQDGAPSLPLLSLFLSFIFFPTSFWRQWAAFLGAWCTLLAFRSSFVEFSVFKCSFDELWGRKWSPRPIPPPSSTLYFKHSNISAVKNWSVISLLHFLHSFFLNFCYSGVGFLWWSLTTHLFPSTFWLFTFLL